MSGEPNALPLRLRRTTTTRETLLILKTAAATVAILALSVPAASASHLGSNVDYGYINSYSCAVTPGYCKVDLYYGGKIKTTWPSKYGKVSGCSGYGVPNGSYVVSSLWKLKDAYAAVIWSPPKYGKDGAINCH